MLELIILGQIPGTNIYLNFSAIAIAILCFVGLLSAYLSLRQVGLKSQVKQEITQNTINSQTI